MSTFLNFVIIMLLLFFFFYHKLIINYFLAALLFDSLFCLLQPTIQYYKSNRAIKGIVLHRNRENPRRNNILGPFQNWPLPHCFIHITCGKSPVCGRAVHPQKKYNCDKGRQMFIFYGEHKNRFPFFRTIYWCSGVNNTTRFGQIYSIYTAGHIPIRFQIEFSWSGKKRF